MATPPSRESPGITVGPDQVWFLSKTVVIYTLRENPDWDVRGSQRIPIYFQKQKYYIVSKSPGKPPHAFRYELAPWPENWTDEANISFTYDEAYVAGRDRDHRADRWENVIHHLLLPFYPLLGLCWSGIKEKVLIRYGFNPIAITNASLLVLWGVALVETSFLFYLHMGYAEVIMGYKQVLTVSYGWLDGFLFFAAPADCLVRYSQVLRGDEIPDGFLEWVFRWKQRHDRRGTGT